MRRPAAGAVVYAARRDASGSNKVDMLILVVMVVRGCSTQESPIFSKFSYTISIYHQRPPSAIASRTY
jgi:hypothetical protein